MRSFVLLLLVLAADLGAQAPDSTAHPIRTNCGVNLDPVSFVVDRAEVLELNATQVAELQRLGERLADENRPLGERFWALAGQKEAHDERRALLFELRMNYRSAMDDIRSILDEPQWTAAFETPPPGANGVVRCLVRAIPVVIGG